MKFSPLILVVIFFSCQSPDKSVSLISKRKANIQTALNQQYPIIRLDSDRDGSKAQEIVLADPRMRDLYFGAGNKPLLNEVFQANQARPGDLPPQAGVCSNGQCYRVDIYNYAENLTAIAIVNLANEKVVTLNFYPGMQPEIPEHLGDLAMEIAAKDPKVIEGYGCVPGWKDVRMQATKTALNQTRCQRSEHLCAAPTFVKGDKALWAVVDLHELKVAGIRWTGVGKTGPAATERLVQNQMVMDCFCDQEITINQEGWSFQYSLTRSDGLEIRNIFWKNEPILQSVKLVDWHVSYSETAQFGYSDAIGCPEYSQAAVIAIEAPEMKVLTQGDDTVGFALVQDYFSEGWPTPCSYNYRQQFEFYKDGGFRPVVASLGRGCGNDGMYRPVTRFALAEKGWSFERKQNDKWTSARKEGWFKETEGYEYHDGDKLGRLVKDGSEGWWIKANKGQMDDFSRGDNAYIYLTRGKPGQGEGDTDLPTIGPCCNTDYRQGPEKFINEPPESLDGEQLIFWYVPELKNDGRPGKEYCWAESLFEKGNKITKVYPCMSGPKLMPRS